MSGEPSVVVEPIGWPVPAQGSSRPNVNPLRMVTSSAAGQIWRHCDDRPLPQIVIYPRNQGPHCDFKRDTKDRVRVGLKTALNLYAQQAYQFAHEFCHVIANHSRENQRHDAEHANDWIEECFCEVASLFALRRMAEEWPQHKSFWSWTTAAGEKFAPELHAYAQKQIEKALVRLPLDQDLLGWLESREQFMRDHPVAIEKDKQIEAELREDYTVIATRLLPLLEANPENWEAISFLNLTQHKDGKLLAEHFEDWKAVCPEKYRQFVGSIERTFVPSAVSNP